MIWNFYEVRRFMKIQNLGGNSKFQFNTELKNFKIVLTKNVHL